MNQAQLSSFDPGRLIARKRDGGELGPSEIRALVQGVVDQSLEDAQLGALLMALFLRGSSEEETLNWTRAMRDSGRVLDLTSIPGPAVDKHSTGGVGDKVSLVLAPLAACLGVSVPMISGRGLGHTGGTVDKLESIPGFRPDLDEARFLEGMRRFGMVFASATAEIAPADRRMYALRDVTGTVASVPLITASILSKKLAEGIGALVLDVKCGRGAFMQGPEDAKALARSLVRTSESLGCRARARITNMDRPLGRAVGNALEVSEALACLRGEGPADLRELVLLLAGDMLELGGVAGDAEEGRTRAEKALDEGRALERFLEVTAFQGGSLDASGRSLPGAPFVSELPRPRGEGSRLLGLDPLPVARAALALGAGRLRKADLVDPAVGVECLVRPGEEVEPGAALFRIHAPGRTRAEEVQALLLLAVRFGEEAGLPEPMLLATVED